MCKKIKGREGKKKSANIYYLPYSFPSSAFSRISRKASSEIVSTVPHERSGGDELKHSDSNDLKNHAWENIPDIDKEWGSPGRN